MSILHIEEPYRTAGKKYRWSGSSAGLGIDLRLLEGDGLLEVTVGNSPKVWQIDKAQACAFIKDRQSFFDAKGVKLGVVAWSKFSSKVEPNNQKKLF